MRSEVRVELIRCETAASLKLEGTLSVVAGQLIVVVDTNTERCVEVLTRVEVMASGMA